jgi:hypothetical protein
LLGQLFRATLDGLKAPQHGGAIRAIAQVLAHHVATRGGQFAVHVGRPFRRGIMLKCGVPPACESCAHGERTLGPDTAQRGGAATQGGASFQLANLFINNHRKLEACATFPSAETFPQMHDVSS